MIRCACDNGWVHSFTFTLQLIIVFVKISRASCLVLVHDVVTASWWCLRCRWCCRLHTVVVMVVVVAQAGFRGSLSLQHEPTKRVYDLLRQAASELCTAVKEDFPNAAQVGISGFITSV